MLSRTSSTRSSMGTMVVCSASDMQDSVSGSCFINGNPERGGTLGNCFVSIRWDSLNDAVLKWTDDTKIVVINN